jgi:hypothetical protein
MQQISLFFFKAIKRSLVLLLFFGLIGIGSVRTGKVIKTRSYALYDGLKCKKIHPKLAFKIQEQPIYVRDFVTTIGGIIVCTTFYFILKYFNKI